jgi:hypothetical protein
VTGVTEPRSRGEVWLDVIWQEAMEPPDQREIWQWLTEEGELPNCYAIPGRLDISGTPFVKEPWQALRHPFVREVTAMAGIQCLKTFIGEGWLLWGIENDPGPTQWLQPTDVEAKEHCEERFIPLIQEYKRIHRFFTANKNDQKTAVILFQHMWMRMEGCGAGNLQRKSVKRQMCSEIWQDAWTPGTLDEAGARLTQFTFNSKRYIESQPGEVQRDEEGEIVGDQILMAYRRGTQKQWCFRCLGCSKLQPFLWTYYRADGSPAGMRWDTTERTRKKLRGNVWGEWIWGELVQTIRYECIFCGHRHYDEPLTRRRISTNGDYAINHSGIWVPQPIGSFENESFNWNQLAVPTLNWFETKVGGVKKFLFARDQAKKGFDGLIRIFMQKVVAEAYDAEKWSHFSRLPVVDIKLDPRLPKPSIVHEGITFDIPKMGVDVQKNHFYALVQYWNANEDILNVWAGKLLTWQEVRDKQLEFKVPDEDVMVDESHRGIETVQNCTRHGHWVTVTVCGKCDKSLQTVTGAHSAGAPQKWKHAEPADHEVDPQKTEPVWLCWKAMRGADRDWFAWVPTKGRDKGKRIQLVYAWPVDRGNPCSGIRSDDPVRKELAGKDCPLITWARPTILDVAIARRDGKVEGVKLLTVKGDWNQELDRQWFSQKKVLDRNSFGQTRWRWKNFTDDHLFDCFLMCLVRKFMKQGLGAMLPPAAPEEEKKGSPPA